MARRPAPFRFQVSLRADQPAAAVPEAARRVEDLGYDTLCVPDHLGASPAPLLTLAVAAQSTTTVRLMPLVLANDLRHPAVLAKELATLDVLSDGRLDVGLGAGWLRSDYEQLGRAMDPPSVRIERLEETISVLRGAWGPGPFSFSGRHHRVERLEDRPRPVQQPGPPILVAGGGRRILSVAARCADAVGLNVRLDAGVVDTRAGATATHRATMEKVAWIREAAGDRSDRLQLATRVHLAMVTNDRDAIADQLAPGLGIAPAEALRSPHALVGTEDQIVEDLLRWREQYGISMVAWGFDAAESMAPVVARLAGR